ncbi:MAG: hypothetical protein PVH73_03050 [Candidatus Bathyarchaeota archaeon]
MAVSIRCNGCGKALFTGRDAIQPYYVRARTECRCPSCGRKLSNNSLSVQVDLLGSRH